jgi:hypothetical protein
MEFKVPEELALEHEELHKQLVKAIEEGGKVGEAAKAVTDVLHPHFEKEEEYAPPPLGLLSPIVEHKRIVAALDNLIDVAKKENKTQFAQFAEKLKLHAKTEEQVLYPSAILIGEYLKLRI